MKKLIIILIMLLSIGVTYTNTPTKSDYVADFETLSPTLEGTKEAFNTAYDLAIEFRTYEEKKALITQLKEIVAYLDSLYVDVDESYCTKEGANLCKKGVQTRKDIINVLLKVNQGTITPITAQRKMIDIMTKYNDAYDSFLDLLIKKYPEGLYVTANIVEK